MTIIYTSFNLFYAAKASVLANSIKKTNPEYYLVGIVVEETLETHNLNKLLISFNEIILAKNLPINNFESWIFGHNVIEACTAVKGAALKLLLDRGASKVIYLDPDILVLNDLSPLEFYLDSNSILLTPHQLDYDDNYQSIIDNEVCSLIHGVYNLGFIAVNNDETGNRFAEWWSSRLYKFCHDDKSAGIFVDQKWIDLVPCLFDNVQVIKDPGYNIASWNLNKRNLTFSRNNIIVNNNVLARFYHFTKLGPVGFTMTQRYSNGNKLIHDLWNWYTNEVNINERGERIETQWSYDRFSNNEVINQDMRILYRNREDLKIAFPTPRVTSDHSFLNWFKNNNK